MTIRFAFGITAAALFALTLAAAQSSAQDDDDLEVQEQPISLTGCVMRETDYRRLNDSGKGGFLGFGGGLGDEYVLVNASRGAAGPVGDCTRQTGGEAFELEGSAEEDLEAFVGQAVAIDGILDEAEIDPATGRPTGGRQVGDDLKLFEVDVKSFRALAPVQTDTLARADVVQQPTVYRDRERDTQARGTRGVQADVDTFDDDRLPRTASPLALTGLLGLLSAGGVAGLRALYRRDRRQFR